MTPRDEAGVATVLRVADAYRVPVVAWGGGSGTQGGSVPVSGGVVLDLTRLDRIVDIDERSLTVTCEPGVNGRRLERELNERGLMLPHYPASEEWATVGGYVAARGSGVLSTRYGKIEDLVLNMRVALAGGEVIETVEVPRHAVGPELTQLFVGSEGTLGVITQVTLEIVPLPALRRFATVRFPDIGAGVEAVRRALSIGARPSVVRMYDDEATRLAFSPVVGQQLDGACTVFAFEGGDADMVNAEAGATLALAERGGRRGARSGARARSGGTAATTSTTPRTSRSCPRSGARSTSSRPTAASRRSTTRCARRSRSRSRTRTSSCACTSRTGTPGGR